MSYTMATPIRPSVFSSPTLSRRISLSSRIPRELIIANASGRGGNRSNKNRRRRTGGGGGGGGGRTGGGGKDGGGGGDGGKIYPSYVLQSPERPNELIEFFDKCEEGCHKSFFLAMALIGGVTGLFNLLFDLLPSSKDFYEERRKLKEKH